MSLSPYNLLSYFRGTERSSLFYFAADHLLSAKSVPFLVLISSLIKGQLVESCKGESEFLI